MNTQERNQMIQGMRDCADWLEAHPDVQVYSGEIRCLPDGREEFAALARAMGTAEKYFSYEFAYLGKYFGPFKVEGFDYRKNVCERKVVGTKIIPARDAYVITASPEHEVEIVEWECGSVLETLEAK